jgi:hypothetical protein
MTVMLRLSSYEDRAMTKTELIGRIQRQSCFGLMSWAMVYQVLKQEFIMLEEDQSDVHGEIQNMVMRDLSLRQSSVSKQ